MPRCFTGLRQAIYDVHVVPGGYSVPAAIHRYHANLYRRFVVDDHTAFDVMDAWVRADRIARGRVTQ